MVFFSFAVNIIEAFFLVLFIAYYFSLKNQKQYLTIMSFVLLVILCAAEFAFQNNGVYLTLSVMITIILSLMIWTKHITFEYVYVTILAILGVLMLTVIGYFLTECLSSFISMSSNLFTIIFCTISKAMQTFFTVMLVKNDFKMSNSLELNQWKSIILLSICLISGITFSGNAVLSGFKYDFINEIFLLLYLFTAILFIYIVARIEKLNNEKIKAIKKKEEIEFSKKQISMMKYLKNEIELLEHRMNYILIQVKTMMTNNDIEGAVNLISQFQNEIHKHKFIINTRNSVFDCLFSLKIDDLKSNGVNVSTSVFITENRVYNDINFIKSITDLLDYFNCCQNLYILMNGTNYIVTLRLIYTNGIINIDKIRAYMETCFSESNYIINEDYETKGFKIIFDMKNYGYEIDF